MTEQLNQKLMKEQLEKVLNDLDDIAIKTSFWTQMELAGGRREAAQQSLAQLTRSRNELNEYKRFLESKIINEQEHERDKKVENTEETDGEV